jgi:hypothetical protein
VERGVSIEECDVSLVECRIPIAGGGALIAERNVTIEECPVQIVECRVLIVEWERNELGRKKTPQPRKERDCGGMS